VLVPRPETECLVEVAVKHARHFDANLPLKILDLGTGSGVVAVSLTMELGDSQVWATDVSVEALKVAEVNADRHRVREKIRFLQGDLYQPFAVEPVFFHMVVSNPPYVLRGEIENLPPEIRDWEPRCALDGGVDGLDLYRRIVERGHCYLVDEGLMVLEIGAFMGEEVSRLFARAGRYSAASVYRDYAGRDRVVVARKLPSNK
jgi:release factor glutamine methyltransferase